MANHAPTIHEPPSSEARTTLAPAPEQPSPAPTHDAFLSYATRADYRLVRRVEAFLESFHRLPRPAKGNIKRLAVFVDGSDLRRRTTGQVPSPLRESVRREVKASRHLVVFCCPAATGSGWVRDEIEWFLEDHRAEDILLVVSEGERPEVNPRLIFPARIVEEGLFKRAWHDLRGARGGKTVRDPGDELIALAAELMSATPEELQPVWWRETRRRARFRAFAYGAIMILLLGVLVSTGAGYLTVRRERNNAERALSDSLLRQGLIADKDGLHEVATLYYAAAHRASANPDALRARFEDERKPVRLTHAWTTASRGKPIHALAISPDDTRVASGGGDGTVLILDANGKEVARVEHGAPVTAVAFSKDLLISGDFNGETRVSNAGTGSPVRSLPSRKGRIRAIAVSAEHVAIAGDDRLVEVMDADAASVGMPIHHNSGDIEAIAFSPKEPHLVALAGGSDISIVDLHLEKELWRACPGGHLTGARSAAFRDDGLVFFTGGDGNTLSTWPPTPARSVPLLSGTSCVEPLGRLTGGEPSYTQVVIDKDVGLSAGHKQSLWAGFMSPFVHALAPLGHRYLASSSRCLSDGCPGLERLATIWDVESGGPLTRAIVQAGTVRALAAPKSGAYLLVAGDDGSVSRWDVIVQSEINLRQPSPVQAISFVPGGLVVSSGWNLRWLDFGGRHVWDHSFAEAPSKTFNLNELIAFDDRRQQRTITAQQSDGSAVIVGLRDGTVSVLDISTGTVLEDGRLHAHAVSGVARIEQKTVSVDVEGELIFARGGRANGAPCSIPGIGAARLSSAATLVARARDDHSILVRSITLGRCTGEEYLLPGLHAAVRSITFDEPRRRIAAGDRDGVILIWDLQQWGEPVRLAQPDFPVEKLAFSDDGELLLSGHYGGTLVTWDLAMKFAIARSRVLDPGTPFATLTWDRGSGRAFVAGGDGSLRSVTIPRRFWRGDPTAETEAVQARSQLHLSEGVPAFGPAGSSGGPR